MFKILRITTSVLVFSITFLKIFSNSAAIFYSSYNNSCNSSLPCDPNSLLTCTGGICQCESPSNQIYISSENICKSTIGGQCTLNQLENGNPHQGRFRQCIENARCVSVTDSTPGHQNYTECKCIENYIENSFGFCVPGIGQPCNYGPNECNPLGMIVCKDNRCQCLDNLQVFDYESKRCVSLAGTHCKIDSLQLGCVRNAVCYPFYYWIPPRCLCKPGFIQSPDRTCVPDPSFPHMQSYSM